MSATSMTPHCCFLSATHPKTSSTKTVGKPKIVIPVLVMFTDYEDVNNEFLGELIENRISNPSSLNIVLEDMNYWPLYFACSSAVLKRAALSKAG